jgi:hypothetical protein
VAAFPLTAKNLSFSLSGQSPACPSPKNARLCAAGAKKLDQAAPPEASVFGYFTDSEKLEFFSVCEIPCGEDRRAGRHLSQRTA